jgi:prepilin-type N-terminal cleavage/methylation domain-containing protein
MASTRRKETAKANRRRGGFTFIELLATVVLIGIVMPVAMQTIALCTQLAGQSRKEMEAASLASVKLTELIASGDWESGARSGEFTDWPGYRWTVDVFNWTESTVRQVDVTVHWQSRGRERELVLSTLVYPEEEV